MPKIVTLSLDLEEEKLAKIKEMMEKAGFVTETDFFNNSITLIAWVIKNVSEGRTIASVNEKEKLYRELEMPFIEHLQKGL